VIHIHLGDNVVAFQKIIKGIASPLKEMPGEEHATHCINTTILWRVTPQKTHASNY
jgi:hypothetical protein